ncbi:MAG: TonB-dependent receptor, partial [Bacteroidetes bacterium]|nr:TonB-dependent receptor [Bacteroidota bacterium]
VPSTSLVRPQVGTQYSMGYFRNFHNNMFEASVELYYKDMLNQVEYREGYLPEQGIIDNPDQGFTFGNGRSYGAEFFLKKRQGQFHGWIGYTWSKTTRLFPEVNQGKEFYAKFDRRHDLSLVLIYDLSPKWTCSTVFVYGTGNAITLPVSRYIMEGQMASEFGERNSFRMPAYHRADISITYTHKREGKFRSSWNFSVFNVYNRYNPYFIYFENSGDLTDGTLDIKALQVSLFPILPSITWNFSF